MEKTPILLGYYYRICTFARVGVLEIVLKYLLIDSDNLKELNYAFSIYALKNFLEETHEKF